MRNTRIGVIGGAMVAAALVAAACGSSDDAAVPADGPTITIGSFNVAQSVVLGQVYGQGLEAAGYPVDLSKLEAGSREDVKPAVESGEMTSRIDRRFSLDEVADAITYSETGRARGKIIINVVDDDVPGTGATGQ